MSQEAPDLSKLRVRGCDLFLLVSLQGLATVGLRERQASDLTASSKARAQLIMRTWV